MSLLRPNRPSRLSSTQKFGLYYTNSARPIYNQRPTGPRPSLRLPKFPLRVWAYGVVAITIICLWVYKNHTTAKINQETQATVSVQITEQAKQFDSYLASQTDEYKLIRLAKSLLNTDLDLTQKCLERAYAINPNSRDIAVLLSRFKPELRDRVKQLDPLYNLD